MHWLLRIMKRSGFVLRTLTTTSASKSRIISASNPWIDVQHRVSHLFQPTSVVPKGATIKQQDAMSKSQKLLLDCGVLRQSLPGMFHFLPLGTKAMDKLIVLIEREMRSVDAQKVDMSILIAKELWDKTGRWQQMNTELFKLTDRHDRISCLGSTHEEAITELISSVHLTYKQLPIKLFQVNKKFRDEIKPRFGLLRAREFVMKDLYSFDCSEETAKIAYDAIGKAYENVFRDKLHLDFIKVSADSGSMGGTISHEYHLISEIGEDKILFCASCKDYGMNEQLIELDLKPRECPKCGSTDLKSAVAIEVGHTFLLGTKYSEPLKATFVAEDGKPKFLFMGCYGLGVSRILAAAVEVLSTANELRWPKPIAPYCVCIIPPKKGSKEESATSQAVRIYRALVSVEGGMNFADDVIMDDRNQLTIGHRLVQAKRIGYPYIIIAGNKAQNEENPEFEFHDVYKETCHFFKQEDLLQYLKENSH